MWHTNLPKYLSDSIELIQTRALKSIFPGESYNDILNDIGLRTLRERREVLCMKYFTEIQGSAHKLNCLLPELRNSEYDLRPGFNRYPYRTNSLIPVGLRNWSLAVTLSWFLLIVVISVLLYDYSVMPCHVYCVVLGHG